LKGIIPAGLGEIYRPIEQQMKAFDLRYRELLKPGKNDYTNQLVKHVSSYNGKRIRPALVMLSGGAGGRLTEQHLAIACAVELMHLATLVHDDILDEAVLRRKRKTTNAIWGNEASVLLGDYLFSRAFAECSSINSTEVSRRLSDIATLVCEGELLQTADRYNAELSEDQYNNIITMKTASLTAFAAEVGAHLAGGTPAECKLMFTFGHNLGMAFQIIDDCLDIVGKEQVVGKSLGTDLNKGKVTLPLIRLLSVADEQVRKQIRLIITNKACHEEEEHELIARQVRQYDCVEYAMKKATDCINEAKQNLMVLPASPFRESMEAISDFVISRSL
jgi:octaprenyl-diphosphate synthase